MRSWPDVLILAMCAIWVVYFGLVAANGSPETLAALARSGTPAWVQGIGSLLAVVAALGIAVWQAASARRDREREPVKRALRVARFAATTLIINSQFLLIRVRDGGPNLPLYLDQIEASVGGALQVLETTGIPDLPDAAETASLNLLQSGQSLIQNVVAVRQQLIGVGVAHPPREAAQDIERIAREGADLIDRLLVEYR